MSRNLVLPFFPVPPKQYDQQYMSEIMRSFATYLTQIQNPGEGRNTELTLTNLQTDDQGLEVGGLFNVDGFIKITEVNRPHVGTNIGTTSVGTVTIVTS